MEDTHVLVMLGPAWVRANSAIRVATRYTAAVRLVANHYAVGDTGGYITVTGDFLEHPDRHFTFRLRILLAAVADLMGVTP